jgi:hypothetical protein
MISSTEEGSDDQSASDSAREERTTRKKKGRGRRQPKYPRHSSPVPESDAEEVDEPLPDAFEEIEVSSRGTSIGHGNETEEVEDRNSSSGNDEVVLTLYGGHVDCAINVST